MDLSVVMISYNRSQMLKKNLECLENQTDKDFELILIDDGSSDETDKLVFDFLKNSDLKTMFCKQEHQGYGLSSARNLGIKLSRSKYIVLLDVDVLPTLDFIEQYKNHFKEDDSCLHIGKLLYINSEYVDNVLSKEKINFSDINNFLELYEKAWGGNLGIPRKIFDELNGFDEDFGDWGGEDSDFALRVTRAGHGISLSDDCLGYHLGTNFLPLEEIMEKKGVKLFNEVKKYDLSIVRNNNRKPENRVIQIWYNKKNGLNPILI